MKLGYLVLLSLPILKKYFGGWVVIYVLVAIAVALVPLALISAGDDKKTKR